MDSGQKIFSESTLRYPIRVLIVDDSAFMRFTITKHLSEVSGITVVGSAHDGEEALRLIPKLKPDVVTLDIEMPRMNGLATLREIMTRFPLPVIMVSSLTSDGARETIQALTLGAVDFVTKPESKANLASIMDDVIAKVRRAAQTKVKVSRFTTLPATNRLSNTESLQNLSSNQNNKTGKIIRPMIKSDKILIIGSSTGGPRALNTVVPEIPYDIPAAVLIIQHMPVGFTRSLAERLDTTSQLAVKEAAPGDALEVGRALVAPGGYHMVLDENNRIALNQAPPVHGVRPSVDVTMASVVQRFEGSVVGVVLTGMGSDGTNGSMLIHSSGGWIIAEAESSCVVWGMPRSVFEAGASNEVLPLPEIAAAIKRAVSKS
ncbi:MAG: chemotaxis response regulator protein-glutamate methylesterase [Chloroflexota bacterium]